MKLQEQESPVLIKLYLKNSEEKFEAAKMFQSSIPDWAVHEAYFSVFHAVGALSTQCGVNFKRKRGSIVSFFHDKFIHTGIFPPEIGTFLGQLETDRLIGDYEVERTITPEKALELLDKAEKVNSVIRDYLKQNGAC